LGFLPCRQRLPANIHLKSRKCSYLWKEC
jgi:hypothetical protein